MTTVMIPTVQEIAAGLSLVTHGACELASSAVQEFVASPSVAQAGLGVVAAQLDVLEQLVFRLQHVAVGIGEVKTQLGATLGTQWHSPAGEAFKTLVAQRQAHAARLAELTQDTARLAQHSIEDLRAQLAALQTLLAAARATVGDLAAGACS